LAIQRNRIGGSFCFSATWRCDTKPGSGKRLGTLMARGIAGGGARGWVSGIQPAGLRPKGMTDTLTRDDDMHEATLHSDVKMIERA